MTHEDSDYEFEHVHPTTGVDSNVATQAFPTLTGRERAIARELALGEKNADIAARLGISVKTVDTHRAHILKKLECRNNVDLARLAIRKGFVQP